MSDQANEIKCLRKLLNDAELKISHYSNYVEWLIAECNKLTAERDAWRKLVMEHNTLRIAQCRNCRESCGDCCPAAYVIHVPSELEQSP